MKSFLSGAKRHLRAVIVGALVLGAVAAARAALPSYFFNAEGGSAIEAALYRLMSLPGVRVLFPRPPQEARTELTGLIQRSPKNAELYSLRALQDEKSLDFIAAEVDWKTYVQNSTDPVGAQIELADFYSRRARPLDEVAALAAAAKMPTPPSEALYGVTQERSWQAFERIFRVIKDSALPKDVAVAQYRTWIARHPAEPSVYGRFFEYLLEQKDWATAQQSIAQYRKTFFNDEVFPVRAQALLEYRQGQVEAGLAVYDKSFQPLWPPELVQSFFDLMRQTRSMRKFLDRSRAALAANPDDLNALARIFYYYQQEGRPDAALQAITDYRLRKDERKGTWTGQELYTLARLLDSIHSYPEAARYYYALHNSKDMPGAAERGLAGITNVLLTAPEEPIRLGSGDISMYRDIATMDQGPGFLNGILSLLLNSQGPSYAYSEQERRAVPYFHRARAAQLLALFDQRFPNSEQRPELRAKLIETYANYGENDAVINRGQQFLTAFPAAPQRLQVGILMADAYARVGREQQEFAIYDALLQELSSKSQNVPLGARASGEYVPAERNEYQGESEISEQDGDTEDGVDQTRARENLRKQTEQRAFSVGTKAPVGQQGARSPEYARVLERYVSRLVAAKQLPQAFTVLRGEIDRNPNDPGLYERLAQFLQQNKLEAQEEEVYKRAIQQFQDKSWYHKLARWYLRQKRDSDYAQLTEQVIKIFSGTELESYFQDAGRAGSPQLYLRLNLYAHQRFPHDLAFVRNLLAAYAAKETFDPAASETLLREHWFQSPDLRDRFFEFLSSSGKLDSELAALRGSEDDVKAANWNAAVKTNPAALTFVAEAELWRSHYEDSAPVLRALSSAYPADRGIGRDASAVYRSLAYFDPNATAVAVEIEQNLLKDSPGDRETLARIGDIYADREMFAQAAPYWVKMADVQPGTANAYLEAATVFWDYYKFDQALDLLDKGRENLGDSALYSYEAGAIYEGKRDYARAVDEYVKGALAQEGSQSQQRLIQLARRTSTRELVDTATARIAEQNSMAAIRLRMAVLDAQNRKSDLQVFLRNIVDRSGSLELLEDIENIAQQRSFESVRQRALERQAAVTTDLVRRLELRYALVRLYEEKKDIDSARRNVEALYQEDPNILGVVRATVDFYWRAKLSDRAIDVLLQASKDAYPDLSNRFALEAANKLTEVGQVERARGILAVLLHKSPYDESYLGAVANTYARAGDDAGLRDFYLKEIESFRRAPDWSQDYRNGRIATLRRGLIPALTRLKDYAGAVDQYIEVLNKYPEDDALTTEASLYTLRYGRQQQLADYYQKTVADSPRDFRWPMVLARVQTNLENYPAAIEAYGKAIAIRQDRTDFYIARASLLERLMRFDATASDYQKLYELSYHDPQWMLKLAETRARQGRTEDVVQALTLAYIEGHSENPQNYFEVARRLETWGMLPQARDFAEQGAKALGDDLLANPGNHENARLWASVLTRLRQQDAVYARAMAIYGAASASPSSLTAIQHQVEKQGIVSVTDTQWRQHERQVREQSASSGVTAVLSAMGKSVDQFFTPEEKISFAEFLKAKRAGMRIADVQQWLLPAAESAGIADLQASWMHEIMMARGSAAAGIVQQLITLQRRRLKVTELGAQLASYAAAHTNRNGADPYYVTSALQSAAEAYRSAGDMNSELRILRMLDVKGQLGSGDTEQRYFELLLQRDSQTLMHIASASNELRRDAAANYIVSHGNAQLARTAIVARGQGLPPVWTKAYTGLAGLYFRDTDPQVNAAFLDVLGNATIGERLGKSVDRDQQLVGEVWFYYGARYGEYRNVAHTGDPEDFLPAEIERTPGRATAYFSLAEYYADNGKLTDALGDYERTLELASDRTEVRDRMAVLLWKQGKRAEAISQWTLVLQSLDKQIDRMRVPESFWSDFSAAVAHLGTRKLMPQFRSQFDAVLRRYIKRNGTYRSSSLMRAAFIALHDPAGGTTWMLDLAGNAPNPADMYESLLRAGWIPEPQREPIYLRIVEAEQARLQQSEGLARDYATQSLARTQMQWLRFLLKMKQYERAQSIFEQLSPEAREADPANATAIQLRLAAHLGTIDRLIETYRNNPDRALSLENLRAAAIELKDAGDKLAARKVLEFVFARQIEAHDLSAPNFLGLAEIRLINNDTQGALELLRRMTLVTGAAFENLQSAADLLLKHGHDAESIDFLEQMVMASPWKPEYRVRLAQAQIKAGKDIEVARKVLVSVAATNSVPYDARAQAAVGLVGARPQADLHSAELQLLASGRTLTRTEVEKPFYYLARLNAAEKLPTPVDKLELLRGALQYYPARDAVRIPIFRAALDDNRWRVALAIIEPLLNGQYLESAQPATDEEIYGEESPDDSWSLDYQFERIPTAQRASIMAGVATAFEKLGSEEQALRYLRQAVKIEPVADTRTRLRAHLNALEATVRRQNANTARIPTIHSALEQEHVVRPRLLAHAAPRQQSKLPPTSATGAQRRTP